MIVIEGANGVGKTTLAKQLVKDLSRFTGKDFLYKKNRKPVNRETLIEKISFENCVLANEKYIVLDRLSVISEAIYGQLAPTTLNDHKRAYVSFSEAIESVNILVRWKPIIIYMENTPEQNYNNHKRDYTFTAWEHVLTHFMYAEFFEQLSDSGYTNIIRVLPDTPISDIVYNILNLMFPFRRGLC